MYEFPPPIWTNQDWTLWRLAIIVMFGLALPWLAAKRTKPKPWRATVWAVVGAVVFCILGDYFRYGSRTYEPHRYMMALPGSLALVCGVTALRIWWQSTDTKSFIQEGFVIPFLLLIIAIVPLPWVNDRRPPSPHTSCKNNLKQIGLAMHNYHDVWSSFPAASLGQPAVSWRIALLPFVEHSELGKRFDRHQSWDSAANADLQKVRVLPYACPARPLQVDSSGRFLTSYVVPTGPGSIFSSEGGTPISQIRDGTSNTLLVMEACGSEIIWTDPRDLDSSQVKISVNGPGTAKGRSESIISSWHFGGAQVGLADGSVRFMNSRMDPAVLNSVLSMNGNEEVVEW